MFIPGLFDDFFEDFARPVVTRRAPAPMAQIMKTDVKETENGYSLDVEVPGYGKDDLKLELKEGYLTITATSNKEESEKDSEGHYLRRERYIGTSSRRFYVGEELTEEDIKAKFENGILNIYIPKKEALPKVPETKYISIA